MHENKSAAWIQLFELSPHFCSKPQVRNSLGFGHTLVNLANHNDIKHIGKNRKSRARQTAIRTGNEIGTVNCIRFVPPPIA